MAIPRHSLLFNRHQAALLLRSRRDPEPSGGRARFERDAAQFFAVDHAIAGASGRAMLHLALEGLGLGPGSRVGLPSYCFYGLVEVVRALGMTAVFKPIDPATLALDPESLDVGDVQAVVVIHPFGQVAPLDALLDRCGGVPLIEDASQSAGAADQVGRVGSRGAAGVLSMVSGKNLQTFGGGLLLTDDEQLAGRARSSLCGSPSRADLGQGLLRWVATSRLPFSLFAWPALLAATTADPNRLEAMAVEEHRPYDPGAASSPLSDLQGAWGALELEALPARNARRRENAARLRSGLEGTPTTLQSLVPDTVPSFNAVAIRAPDGLRLARWLLRRGIDTRLDYMEWFGPPAFSERVLYLPNHARLRPRHMDRISAAVRRFYA